MTAHFFLLRDSLKPERLSWIEELLKFYFLKLNPQSFLHASKERDPAFAFFLTGNALYSIQNPATLEIWDRFLSLPSVKIVCDQEELALRGISSGHLKMKNPDQVITHNSLALNGRPSFWKDVMKYARQHEQPIPSALGYLNMISPYMNSSSEALLGCLGAVIESHASWDLYCYLDGVYLTHPGQNPLDAEKIGDKLVYLAERTGKRGLRGQITASARCAAARGYCSIGKAGEPIPACSIQYVKFKDLLNIAADFRSNHIILADNCAAITMRKDATRQPRGAEERARAPPVTILVTSPPYGSEFARGALAFALACAENEIETRVVFIEDGVYCVTGVHSGTGEQQFPTLLDHIDSASCQRNIQFFVFIPSLNARNVARNAKLTAVIPITIPDLGNLLFYPPEGTSASHQRVLFF